MPRIQLSDGTWINFDLHAANAAQQALPSNYQGFASAQTMTDPLPDNPFSINWGAVTMMMEYPGWMEITDLDTISQDGDIVAVRGFHPDDCGCIAPTGFNYWRVNRGGNAPAYTFNQLNLASLSSKPLRIWRKVAMAAPLRPKLTMNPIYSKPLPLP